MINETTFIEEKSPETAHENKDSKGPKIKTRPDPASSSQTSLKSDSKVCLDSDSQSQESFTASTMITVTKRVMAGLKSLSTGATLAWKEFVYIMSSLKFSVEHVGGSAVRFVPETEGDEPITGKISYDTPFAYLVPSVDSFIPFF